MSIGIIFLMSLVCVAGFLLTVTRCVGWGYILRRATATDLIFTIAMMLVLSGTLTGMLIAILAGLVMAGVLSVGKALQRGVKRTRAAVTRPVDRSEDWAPKYGWDEL